MTAALAIAATSEVLRHVVEDAMVRASQALGFTAPPVTTGPPPRPPGPGAGNGGAVEAAGVNLFLHHVTPNPAWRNMHAPERDSQGRRLNNAPLVLDLHYLLSAHGADTARDIGFGTALHALHQVPILPREQIRQALRALAEDADANRKALAGEGLAEQFESLTVTPQALDIDAMTKIWTATQSPYRPSAGYLVTTVFLEDRKPAREALPVGSFGAVLAPLGRLGIETATGWRNGQRVPLAPGTQIAVEGEGFDKGPLSATLGLLPLVADGTASRASRLVFNQPAGLRPGPHLLQIARTATIGGHSVPVQSAGASIVLHPAITGPAPQTQPDVGDASRASGTITVDITPAALREDTVRLVLTPVGPGDDIDIPWRAPAPAQPPVDQFTQLSFTLAHVPRGTYIVRVGVNGVLSQPELPQGGQFGPRVTL